MHTMRRFLQGVLFAVAAAALVAPQQAAAQTRTVKIGLSAPITGDQAQYGADFRRGLELAIERLNRDNVVPGVKFEAVVEDSKSDPKEAANVAQKFASGKEVLAVVGDFSSTAVLAAAPIYQRAKIIMLTPTASHPDITKTGDYIFRNTPIAQFEANAVADWATKEMGAKKIAVIGRNDDYGRVQSQFFAARSKANGAEVVATEFINPADKDFKPLITAIRGRNPDVTLLALFQVEAALLLQQAREMGFKTTFMSGASLFNPQLISLAGDTADGVLLVSSYFPGDPNPTVQGFVKAYQAKYNALPSKFAAHSYDATMMIADAVKRAGSTDGQKVRDALAATKGYQGIIGSVTVDPNREVILVLQKLQVAKKEFGPYKK